MLPKPGHRPEQRRTIGTFVLAMLSLAVVISLRNLPLTAEYGLSSLFFYLAATVVFMIPYAFVSAELASGWPKAGGVYVWVREALGDRWGFFAIWMQWFHNMTWYPAMLAFIAAGIAYVFDPFLVNSKGYILTVILTGFWGVTLLNFLGIRTSSLLSTICVIVGALIPGAILITFGFNWWLSGHELALNLRAVDFIPDLSHITNLVFLAGIFLSLSGLEANANLAREVKNPQKSFPRAIFIAALLTLGILVLGSIAIAIVIPQQQISLVSGVLDAFAYFFIQHKLRWMIPVVALATVAGALGELNAWAIAGVKGLFVTTEHGSLPPFFHKLNKHYTPTRLLFLQACIVTVTSFVFLYLPNVNVSYWILSALSAQMYLVMYILLLLSGIVLRVTRPKVPRAYKVPGGKWGIWVASIVGICACLFALAISFLPPPHFEIGSLFTYETLIISGFVISCLIPLTLHAMRKPHWQLEVLEEIREEIHRSTH